MTKRIFLLIFTLCFIGTIFSAQADQAKLKPFISGSYQQLLSDKLNKPFMMVLWSITCSSCLKDMAFLNKLHKSHPNIDMVMLSTDDVSAHDQIQQILVKNELIDLENWYFADENAQKLRYEIDPKWYGEQPKTYFFDNKHERQGISGVLTQDDYEQQFNKILH